MKWLSLVIIIGLFVLISIYVGKYMYSILFKTKSFMDPVMDKVDNAIYKVAGIEEKEMNWKEYVKALLTTNIVMIVVIFILLMVQQFIVGAINPSLNMNWHTAFNTAISFMTNTNLQDYTGYRKTKIYSLNK